MEPISMEQMNGRFLALFEVVNALCMQLTPAQATAAARQLDAAASRLATEAPNTARDLLVKNYAELLRRRTAP